MTEQEIRKVACQVGMRQTFQNNHEQLKQFAKIWMAIEREACATIADTSVDFWVKAGYPEGAEAKEAMVIAETIRARGEALPIDLSKT